MAWEPVLVCAALARECRIVSRRLAATRTERDPEGRPRVFGSIAGTHVVVQQTGIGLRAAQASLRRAVAQVRPRSILSIGFAGGLSPAAAAGDVVVPDRVAREGRRPIATDSELRAQAAIHLPEGRSRRGLLVSVDRVVQSPADKADLCARTQAEAVDMESAAVVEEARAAAVPVLVVRAVSDDASTALPDLGGLDLDRTSGRLRLAARALGSPRQGIALLRLAHGTRQAATALDEVLERLLPRLQ